MRYSYSNTLVGIVLKYSRRTKQMFNYCLLLTEDRTSCWNIFWQKMKTLFGVFVVSCCPFFRFDVAYFYFSNWFCSTNVSKFFSNLFDESLAVLSRCVSCLQQLTPTAFSRNLNLVNRLKLKLYFSQKGEDNANCIAPQDCTYTYEPKNHLRHFRPLKASLSCAESVTFVRWKCYFRALKASLSCATEKTKRKVFENQDHFL